MVSAQNNIPYRAAWQGHQVETFSACWVSPHLSLECKLLEAQNCDEFISSPLGSLSQVLHRAGVPNMFLEKLGEQKGEKTHIKAQGT